MVAQAMGHKPGAQYKYSAPPVFLFEPHQPEQCNYKPDLLLKIDEVWKEKYEAFQILAAQKHLWGYYERVALNRGIQGSRNTGVPMTYGEAYQRLFPTVRRSWHEARRRSQHQACRSRRDGGVGVSTVHEALRPPRPDEALFAARLGGRVDRWPRRHRAGAARRQLDDPCRRRAVQEGRHPRRRLHHRQYRRHVRRAARDLAAGARRAGADHRRRLPRRQSAARR